MKTISRVSLAVLSFVAFDVNAGGLRDAINANKAKGTLVSVYEFQSVKQVLGGEKRDTSAKFRNVVKKTLNKGKEKAEEVFDGAKDATEDVKNKVKEAVSDSDEKKSGLFGLFKGKRAEDKADESSSSGIDDVEDEVKGLGKKAEKEVKNASGKMEDNVKKVSDGVKYSVDEAASDVEDFESDVEDDAEEIENGEKESRPGFFSRLFGNRSGEDDTLADSSESEYDDSESEIDDDDDAETEHDASEVNEEGDAKHLLDEDEVNSED